MSNDMEIITYRKGQVIITCKHEQTINEWLEEEIKVTCYVGIVITSFIYNY